MPRGLPASVAVPPPPLGLLVHGGAGRPGAVLPRSRYRRARRPPMLRRPYAPVVLPFFSAGAEKRERRASFYNIIRIFFSRALRLIPGCATLKIFAIMLTIRPCFYVSAPSGRQSCRNIAVPRPHAWGGGISLRLRRAVCSLRCVSLCAACRPAKPWGVSAKRPIPFPPASPDDAGQSAHIFTHTSGSYRVPLTILIYSLGLQSVAFRTKRRTFTDVNQTFMLMTSDVFRTSLRNTDTCRPASGIARHPAARQLENRSYGFKELAVLYFPNIAPASASIRLKAWIKDSPELLQALDETHYHLTARVLTPRQKDLIAVAFGSPF